MAGAAFLHTACARPPEAELVASVTIGQAPLSVSFTNNSKDADEFRWDFGDGTTTTTATMDELVTHEYTKLGKHTVTLTAIKEGEPPQTSTVIITIMVDPGSLDHVSLEPATPTVELTQEQQFRATALDQFDNPIPGLAFAFQSEEAAGQVDSEGMFTAGTKAGTFEDALRVQVAQGQVTRTATTDITIEPGALDRDKTVPATAMEIAVLPLTVLSMSVSVPPSFMIPPPAKLLRQATTLPVPIPISGASPGPRAPAATSGRTSSR